MFYWCYKSFDARRSATVWSDVSSTRAESRPRSRNGVRTDLFICLTSHTQIVITIVPMLQNSSYRRRQKQSNLVILSNIKPIVVQTLTNRHFSRWMKMSDIWWKNGILYTMLSRPSWLKSVYNLRPRPWIKHS